MTDQDQEDTDQSDFNSGADEDSITEDEIEPKFKYQRIDQHLKDILNKDVVTACAVHLKFLILGTFLGRIYILDHQGNTINCDVPTNSQSSQFTHTVAVNEIDIDAKGEYVATCSDDGKVHIIGLVSPEHNQTIIHDRPVYTVALDPDPKITEGRRFIVGDNKLILYEKNFLNKLQSTVLAVAEGHVKAMSWNGSFIAWASCASVHFYDLNGKCSLGVIKWLDQVNARLENFRCNFHWANLNTLLIGWVDTVRVCVIRKRSGLEATMKTLPNFIVDPISTFQTNSYVSGLAFLTSNQLTVLGYPKKKDADRKALRPIFTVWEYTLNHSEEIIADSLSLRGYKEYSVNDYILRCLPDENRYYFIAPKDVVVATLFDIEDRLQWLIEHKKFEDAMEIVPLNGGNVLPVARLYIDYLLVQNKYESAAKVCLKVFGNNKDLWEEEIFKFVKPQKLRYVSAYLPTSEKYKLDPHVYEMVMYEFLKFDVSGFLKLIKEWPSHLYDCAAVINAIHDNFRKEHVNELLESLALLYSYKKDYESAVRMYLKLKNKAVFDLIKRHELYEVIYKMLIPLIQLDRVRAFQIILDKNKISSEAVIEQLQMHQEYLYWYLDALHKVDSRGTFHWTLITLYAKYERDKLLPFLKRSKHYTMQDALDLCKSNFLYPEMVYLLGQMGNIAEALNIVIYQLKDFEMAIEFCKEHNDSDLWDILINESVENPQILTKLFDGIIGYVDPVGLMNKIKVGQKIPELQKSLTKMLWDYRLQGNAQQNCYDIQLDEYFHIHSNIVHLQNRGLCITNEKYCAKCHHSIIQDNILPNNDIIVFKCGHVYHEICVPHGLQHNEFCGICFSNDLYDNDN